MRLALFTLFFGLLFSTVFPHSVLVSNRLGSIIVVTFYAAFGSLTAIRWWRGRRFLRSVEAGFRAVYPTGLVCLLVILFLYAVHIVFGPYALTGLVFPLIVIFNFVYVPRVIPPDTFLRFIAIIAALVALVGVAIHVAVIIGVAAGLLLWPSTYAVPLAGGEIHPMRSLTSNPNIFGRLMFAGVISSLVFFDRDRQPIYGVLLTIGVLGLLLSVSRSSWIAVIVAIAIYAAYTRGGRTPLLITLCLLPIATISVIVLVVVLNNFGYHVTFTGRVPLWSATVQAIVQRPLFGYGLGSTTEIIAPFVEDPQLVGNNTHNAYLRMALHLGVLGGIAYLVLLGWAFFEHLRNHRVDIAFVAIAGGSLIVQLFEAETMYQITSFTVVMTIVFGYLVAGQSWNDSVERR